MIDLLDVIIKWVLEGHAQRELGGTNAPAGRTPLGSTFDF